MDVQWFCGIKYLPKPMANLRYPPNQMFRWAFQSLCVAKY